LLVTGQSSEALEKSDLMSIRRLRQGVSDELPGVTIQSFAEAKQPIHGEAALTSFKQADLLIDGACTLGECFQGPSTSFPNNLDSILYAQVDFLGRMPNLPAISVEKLAARE
jgi:hypothetical protein